MLRELPIGLQDFERLIRNSYVYVDKTEYIWRMMNPGGFYFLARPRRFGKSLMLSVIEELCRGKKELFKGLWIEDKWDFSKEIGVIRINFNEISRDNPSVLEGDLRKVIEEYFCLVGEKEKEDLSLIFLWRRLVLTYIRRYPCGIVILVDEYDKPIIDHLGVGEERLEIAKANRELLRNFYTVLKDSDIQKGLRLLFITGVSKFSKVGIFSGLNNPEDITLADDYAEILGITEEELERYFGEYISNLAKYQGIDHSKAMERLKEYYNGYRFAERGREVYNPFSLLNCLRERKFRNYWFETCLPEHRQAGTPTFLVNLIKEQDFYLPQLEGIEVIESDFISYELEDLYILPLLFQTGYLTIRDIYEDIYTLGYPNLEVKKAFSEVLFKNYTSIPVGIYFPRIRIGLSNEKIEEVIEVMRSVYGSIPYTLVSRIGDKEGYYHTIFYLLLSGLGIEVRSELLVSRGRIDIVIEIGELVYIIEFKVGQSGEKGIEQIKEKGYHLAYVGGKRRKVYLVGIGFSLEERNIKDWKVEVVGGGG